MHDVPQPPDRLSPDELHIWHELFAMFAPLRSLRTADGPLLELIVKTWATWQRAEADIAAHGSTTLCKSGYEQQRASVAISLKNRQLLRQLLNEIGATPTSRTNVDTLPVKSALQEFLTRTKETHGQLQQSS